MLVIVKHANWRKAQISTGCTTGEIPETFRKWEQKTRASKKEWKWQRGTVAHPLSEGQWIRDYFSMTKWEFEMQVEGFRRHVATDGSLLDTAGK